MSAAVAAPGQQLLAVAAGHAATRHRGDVRLQVVAMKVTIFVHFGPKGSTSLTSPALGCKMLISQSMRPRPSSLFFRRFFFDEEGTLFRPPRGSGIIPSQRRRSAYEAPYPDRRHEGGDLVPRRHDVAKRCRYCTCTLCVHVQLYMYDVQLYSVLYTVYV